MLVLLIAGAFVGLVLLGWSLTENGKNFWKIVFNIGGARANLEAQKRYTAELRQQNIVMGATKDAQDRTRQLEESQIANQEVVDSYESLVRKLDEQQEIWDIAKANLGRLHGDKVPDEKQKEEIGTNENALLNADGIIASTKVSIEALKPEFDLAIARIEEAGGLKNLVNTLKEDQINRASVATGIAKSGQAEASFYQAASGVTGESKTATELQELESYARRAKNGAKFAKDTFQRVPTSAMVQKHVLSTTRTAREERLAEILGTKTEDQTS